MIMLQVLTLMSSMINRKVNVTSSWFPHVMKLFITEYMKHFPTLLADVVMTTKEQNVKTGLCTKAQWWWSIVNQRQNGVKRRISMAMDQTDSITHHRCHDYRTTQGFLHDTVVILCTHECRKLNGRDVFLFFLKKFGKVNKGIVKRSG